MLEEVQQLPDAAGFGGDHGLAGLAAEGWGEAGLVDDDSVDAEAVWRVGVVQHLRADGLRARVLAPVLGEGDVEALWAGETVALGGEVDAVVLGALHIGHEGEQEAAVVGGVFAEGELAVDVDVVDGGEGAVLVDQAIGAGGEVLEVGGGPPVVKVAEAVELAALVVEAVGEFVADDGADVSVVDGDILACGRRRAGAGFRRGS